MCADSLIIDNWPARKVHNLYAYHNLCLFMHSRGTPDRPEWAREPGNCQSGLFAAIVCAPRVNTDACHQNSFSGSFLGKSAQRWRRD